MRIPLRCQSTRWTPSLYSFSTTPWRTSKRAAIAYAGVFGTEALAGRLEETQRIESLATDSYDALARISVRTDPERAVYQLLESKIRPVKEALDELQRQAASIKDAELESALAHENSDVRYVTATILLDRGRLSEGIANCTSH